MLGTAELFQPAWSQLCRTESPNDNFSKPHRSWGGAGRWRPFPPPPGAHPGRWYGLAGGAEGGGGLESWFQTHSAQDQRPGAWQLWFTHVRPALTAPMHTGGDRSESDWLEVQSYRKLGLAFRPPTPAPSAEYSHFLKSESPPGDSEPPEGTTQAHMAMQRPQPPCVTRRWGPDADSPGAEGRGRGRSGREEKAAQRPAGWGADTHRCSPGAPLPRASLSVAPALFHLPRQARLSLAAARLTVVSCPEP